MIKILKMFSKMTNLVINIDKSNLLGINSSEEKLIRLVSSIGCTIGAWYLGVALSGDSRKRAFWDPIIVKVSKKLAS